MTTARRIFVALLLMLVPATVPGRVLEEGRVDLMEVLQAELPENRLIPLLRRWSQRKRDKGGDVRDLTRVTAALTSPDFPRSLEALETCEDVEVELLSVHGHIVAFDSSRFGLRLGVTCDQGLLSLYVPELYSRAVEGWEKGAPPPPNSRTKGADFTLLRAFHALLQGLQHALDRGGVERIEIIGGDVLNTHLIEVFQSLGMRLKQPDNAWVLELDLRPEAGD